MKHKTHLKTPHKTVIDLIIEINKNGHYWGRIEDHGNFMPTGQGKNIKSLINNVVDSIEDYVANEGKKDPYWSELDLMKVEFDLKYDLQSLFDELSIVKVSGIGKLADINESLMRQYASGNKYPSFEQTKKIEKALHSLGEELQKVSIFA